ncbi:MAG: bifunctional folylpolyglutamate synthase/dihydrofolate synthase [Muribaculaceae bacterium]|nr:bifunctional folylpolyglutamate synthase/dihydrofolate synthase [Muribaculaceae bacterium]
MTYEQTLDYLYTQRPAFERQGAAGYKPGLQTAVTLDDWLGHPHRRYRCIHVAGTNGKGSVSHLLAAILQLCGYRVGLFTSPHFVDFRERIRVNGECVPQAEVVDFVERFKHSGLDCSATFFELTSALAMDYFARQRVDVAIFEVGMGGRLDSTNIITPMLCIITNISLDHTEFLGDTLEQIAAEKAGIIKPGVPVVVGEAEGGVRRVFERKAAECGAPITFAHDEQLIADYRHEDGCLIIDTLHHGNIRCELAGDYQVKNAATVLAAVRQLRQAGFDLPADCVAQAFHRVGALTGLRGRWTRLGSRPTVIADSGHNIAGITAAMQQLRNEHYRHLHMVLGFMADKDLAHILPLLPRQAHYHFTQASTPRALTADLLRDMAATVGLHGDCHPTVVEALDHAKQLAKPDDLIYVGGSMYVLAELFTYLDGSRSSEDCVECHPAH